MLLQHILHLIPSIPHNFLDEQWVQFSLALPVFIIGVLHFGRSSYQALKLGIFHMDLLIFIGSTSAFIYSFIGAITSNPDLLFFETSAMIITLVLVGNYIENRTVKKTQSAIESLKSLQVNEATRLNRKTGKTEIIPLKDLKLDDIVVVNEGDTIPSDGVIVQGECWVDESLISGESDPIQKSIKEEVIGSSILASGSIQVQLTRIGSDTILSKIIDLVKKAQREKPKIQRLADKISAVFVPLVISIAVLTFILSQFVFEIGLTKSILNSIAVLVISCPCAMGLATPTAIAAGVGRLSRIGILVKSGKIMESFARTTQMIFDKTGTLTSGSFEISSIIFPKGNKEHYKKIIYILEKHSSHPIAKSIVKFLNSEISTEDLPFLDKIEEMKGKGMKAIDSLGHEYFLGNSINQDESSKSISLYENMEEVAVLKINDQLREGAKFMVKSLKDENIQVSMLSGDNESQVKKIAESLEIDEYYAGKSPQQKYDIIEKKNQDSSIAMVGDGINDAASLSRADIGISLSDSTRIAINAADIVLMNEDLSLLPNAVRISRQTLKTIKQNLFWAFSYNIIAIPLAAFGFLNPMWGALFMTFSDIIVVGNSIRLMYRKI